MFIFNSRAFVTLSFLFTLYGCGGGSSGGTTPAPSPNSSVASSSAAVMSSSSLSVSSTASSKVSSSSSSVSSTPLTPSQWIQNNAQTLTSTDPANEDYADLAAFGNAIGNARIVGLAEQSHGGKEEFELKTRLVKYLHTVKGFDVLILESGFYDVGRIWEKMQKGAAVDDEAVGNIFFMYSESAEGRKLLQYIDATQKETHPLQLAGMDSQHTGVYSQNDMMTTLESFLNTRSSSIPANADWATFKAVSNAMFKRFNAPYSMPSISEQTSFRQIISLLNAELCATQTDNYQTTLSPGWWCQVSKSIDGVATLYWSNPSDDQREPGIGRNVIWLAEHPYAGKKIIVWGHAVHTLYNYPFDTTHNSAGTDVRNHFGTDYYVANVTAFTGSIRLYSDLNVYAIPDVDTNGLETLLNNSGKTLAYINNPASRNGIEWLDTTNARLTNFFYIPTINANGLGHNFDTYFYFKTVSPITMVR